MLSRAKKYCEQACNQALIISIISLILSSMALIVSLREAPRVSAEIPALLTIPDRTADYAPAGQFLSNPEPPPQPAIQPAAQPKKPAASKKRARGTCRAELRGLTSFACPGTPTEDVCGEAPFLTCFLGADESCPPGKNWDPACSCTCIDKP